MTEVQFSGLKGGTIALSTDLRDFSGTVSSSPPFVGGEGFAASFSSTSAVRTLDGFNLALGRNFLCPTRAKLGRWKSQRPSSTRK